MSNYQEPTSPSSSPPPPPVTPAYKPKPAPPEESTTSIFPMILAVAFLGVLVASWVAQGSPPVAAIPPAPPLPGAAAEPATNAAPEVTPVAPAAVASALSLEGVKAEFDGLAKKIAELPKPEPAPDLKPIQDKIDGLAKTVEGVAGVPKKIDDLGAKLAESERLVTSLKDELAQVKADLKSKLAAPVRSPSPAAAAISLAPVADLFNAGKYADALATLKTLPADDARVQYYTALAMGVTTQAWTGETEKTVLKGVALEKAGTPKTAEIDAAFADLTEQQGKAWLAFYRQKAK